MRNSRRRDTLLTLLLLLLLLLPLLLVLAALAVSAAEGRHHHHHLPMEAKASTEYSSPRRKFSTIIPLRTSWRRRTNLRITITEQRREEIGRLPRRRTERRPLLPLHPLTKMVRFICGRARWAKTTKERNGNDNHNKRPPRTRVLLLRRGSTLERMSQCPRTTRVKERCHSNSNSSNNNNDKSPPLEATYQIRLHGPRSSSDMIPQNPNANTTIDSSITPIKPNQNLPPRQQQTAVPIPIPIPTSARTSTTSSFLRTKRPNSSSSPAYPPIASA